MFDYQNAGISSQVEKVCRVDPEEMLQRAKQTKERMEKLLNAILEASMFVGGFGGESEKALTTFIGQLTVSICRESKDMERWLAEMNKS